MKTYTCDNCARVLSNDDALITIGSKNEREFKYKNNLLEDRAMVEMTNHIDLHFCSKFCFIHYFFHEKQ